jgi:hypothetical protein
MFPKFEEVDHQLNTPLSPPEYAFANKTVRTNPRFYKFQLNGNGIHKSKTTITCDITNAIGKSYDNLFE